MKIKALLTLSILLNFSLGTYTFLTFTGHDSISQKSPLIEKQQKYPFLSKRIFTENQNDYLINFIPLRSTLTSYVGSQKEEIGIYFEYLPTGVSIGIQDRMTVKLSSLVKIPIVMAVYKQIALGTVKKTDTLILKKEFKDPQFGSLWREKDGAQITVERAINLALTESDNTASNLLLNSIQGLSIDNVFDSLDVPKDKKDNLHLISPKGYSSILRSLYLSSYLEEQHSNEILHILTQTKFDSKLPAGVPNAIPVAHKIGVFDRPSQNERYYSDCGIIFEPQRPYMLCIMVKGDDTQATKHISSISKLVYDHIHTANK